MSTLPTPEIDSVRVLELVFHGDRRGSFVETYREEWFPSVPAMVQTNVSSKAAGAVVGLHFHRLQADYWYVLSGTARVGLYDLRQGSPTEGRTWVCDLGADLASGLYIPPGVGHGFAALTDVTMLYQVDRYYDPADELGVAWDDPALGIDWGIDRPVVSERDGAMPSLASLDASLRPLYGDGYPPNRE